MSLIFRKPGMLTTVQDMGRTGYRMFGINPNGVMDVAAARLINAILGNRDSAAVIEMHFPAPEIEFDEDAVIAIGGGDLGAQIGGQPVANFNSAFARKGDVLQFAERRSGNRAYVAVRGGVHAPVWLGSSSTNLAAGAGGISGRRIMAGDRVDCENAGGIYVNQRIGPSILPRYSRFPTVRIIAGSEYEILTATSERMLLEEPFTLTKDCDRMGYRLSGKPLHLIDDQPMVSSAVNFGTIQLLPDGQMIILMADHQTSGGYPRIGNVITVDLPIVAQCGPGDGVGFELVTIKEAEVLAFEFENKLNFLRAGCSLRGHNVHN